MAVDMFLKLGDGKKAAGESTDSKHAGEIELKGFSFGASNPSSVGSAKTGSGSGKVNISAFNVTKGTDASSAVLFQMCAAGDHFDTATVTIRKAGKDALEYLIYTFTKVYIDSVQWYINDAKGEEPEEGISLSFASVHVKYTPQKPDGTGGAPVEGGWNVATNKPQ